MLGKYKFEKFLAKGGFGSIYKAFDTKLKRNVAIKVIKAAPGPDRDRGTAEMENESQVTAQVPHANIMTVIDIVTDCDLPYMICEYISGSTLMDYINKSHAYLRNETLVMMLAIDLLTALAVGRGRA